MQWRWLFPLLISFPNSPFLSLPDHYSLYTSILYSQHILHYLSIHHLFPNQPPSYTWPLLFSACRHSSLTKNIFVPFKSLFDSLDLLICRSYFNVNINLPTSLCLPASDIIQTRPILPQHPPQIQHVPPNPKYFNSPIFKKKLFASHTFIIDLEQHTLRYRYFSQIEIQTHGNTTKTLITSLRSKITRKRAFIEKHFHDTNPINISLPIDLLPFTYNIFQLSQSPSPSTVESLLGIVPYPSHYSTLLKKLKHTPSACPCSTKYTSESHRPRLKWPISGISWSRFWSYKIPLKARTIWYRIIHNRIPYRGILYFIFPDKTPTDICSRRSLQSDSIFHFFFGCLTIKPVWNHFLPLLTPLPIFKLDNFLSETCHALQTLPRSFPPRWLSEEQFQSLSQI